MTAALCSTAAGQVSESTTLSPSWRFLKPAILPHEQGLYQVAEARIVHGQMGYWELRGRGDGVLHSLMGCSIRFTYDMPLYGVNVTMEVAANMCAKSDQRCLPLRYGALIGCQCTAST